MSIDNVKVNIGNSEIVFETTDEIDFTSSGSGDPIVSAPLLDSNGEASSYTLTRFVRAISGKTKMSVVVDAFDENDDKLSYHFEIVPESNDIKSGGDFEKTPESVYKKIFDESNPIIKAPLKKGKY